MIPDPTGQSTHIHETSLSLRTPVFSDLIFFCIALTIIENFLSTERKKPGTSGTTHSHASARTIAPHRLVSPHRKTRVGRSQWHQPLSIGSPPLLLARSESDGPKEVPPLLLAIGQHGGGTSRFPGRWIKDPMQKMERKIDKVVLKHFPCCSDREKLVSITSNHQLCNKKNQRSAGSLISEINSLTFSIFSEFLLLNFSTTGFLIKTVDDTQQF